MSVSSLKRHASAMESDREVRWKMAKLLKVKAGSIGNLRKTDDKKISMIDVVSAVAGKGKHDSARILKAICKNFPKVEQKLSRHTFQEAVQQETPIADSTTMIEIIMLLPGSIAADVRIEASKLLVRYLDDDLKLVDEVQKLSHIQEEMVDFKPLHALCAFGKVVEASSGGSSSSLSELRAEFADALEATKAEFEESLAKVKMEVLEAVKEVKEAAREANLKSSLQIVIAD